MKLVSMLSIAILLFSAVSCKNIVNRKRGTSTMEPMLGNLDVPKKGDTLKGSSAIVGGWAVAEDGVQRVAIYVDKQFVTFASLGGDRPDIAKLYPAFKDAGKSGYNVVLDLTGLLDGDHEMLVQIKSNSGNIKDLPMRPFKVAHDAQ